MNETLGQNNIRLLYYRYKDSTYFVSGVIALIVLASIILVTQVVIPQVQSWFSIRDEVIATRDKIDVLNNNIAFMNNINKSQLDEQVKTATKALPVNKDFAAILNAVADSAQTSGVSLQDFSFQVGDINAVKGQQDSLERDLSQVKLIISVNGTFDSVEGFLKKIAQELPLSEVTDVEGDLNGTTITLQFYQKAFPNIVFDDETPLVPISNKDSALLDKMNGWQPPVTEGNTSDASNSALPLF